MLDGMLKGLRFNPERQVDIKAGRRYRRLLGAMERLEERKLLTAGLQGEYFNDIALTSLADTRVDSIIDFRADWGNAPPGTAVTSDDTYSGRWVGYVRLAAAGDWSFYTTSDDGVRLWVNNQLLIDNWIQHPVTEDTATVSLQAGWYPIRLEHFQNGGTAEITLSFSGPGQPKAIIPSTHLSTVSLNYPNLQSPQGLDDPILAYGLNGLSDWSAQMPFIDLMKTGRAWIASLPGQWGGGSVNGVLDENGWPTTMPVGVEKFLTAWDWSHEGAPYDVASTRDGRYVLTYDGNGDVRVWGATQVVSTSPGEIIFDLDGDNAWGVEVRATDTGSTGDYVRNFTIVHEDHVDLHAAGAIFNPEWLRVVKDVRQVRFMDWMHTNNSEYSTWEEYPDADWYTYSDGAPVAVMVALANEIGADPWFNIPFDADDNYVEQFARYVRDHLDPALQAHIELSNEVWNWSLRQAQDARDRAEIAFGVTGGAGWVNYYAKRATEVMVIWSDVFAGQLDRITRVGGIQPDWRGLEQQILLAPMWQTADPARYVAPHTYFDAIASTSYFGGSHITDVARRNELLAVLGNPSIDPVEWLYNRLKTSSALEGGTVASTLSNLQYFAGVADSYGLDLLLYEGGSHVHHSAFINIPEDQLNQLQTFMIDFTRSERMADLYQQLWDGWRGLGDGPFMQFVDVQIPNRYGSWGARATLADSTPRSQLLDALNQRNDAWWENRGGSRFQHGLIVNGTSGDNTLPGTSKNDYLIGGEGEDVFYPGPGDDGINGGPGEDVVMLRGNRSQYTVNSEGAGYRVIGADGSNYLYAVEFLYFEDGTTHALNSSTANPAYLSIAANNASQNEGNSGTTSFTFTVTRTGNTTLSSMADWVVAGSGSSPASGSDFSGGVLPSGSVSFAAGESTRTITVSVAGDTSVESDEGFTITLSNPSAQTLINTASANGLIVNDDTASSSARRTASPFTVKQIHSGHSLTDSYFAGTWPGLLPNLLQAIAPGGNTGAVARSTIPGSPMSWRWNNPPCCLPDARADIGQYELLVITENNLIAPEALFPGGWQADLRNERRADFLRWVNHARQNGNNGRGAEVILYTNWPAFSDFAPAASWRARLAANEVEWRANADNAAAGANTDIFIVPGNELMMRLWDDAEAGRIPGISSGSQWQSSGRWWLDDVHPASLGSLSLAYLMAGVVHHVDPRGLPHHQLGLAITPTAAEASYIQNLVWDIMNNYARAGYVTSSTPKIDSIVVNNGHAQRSKLSSIAITFDSIVSVAPDAFTLQKRSGDPTVPPTNISGFGLSIAFNGGKTIATLTFGSLDDGNYQVITNPAKVLAAGSVPLASSASDPTGGDFVFGDKEVDNFFNLFGDGDGDGDVDATDLFSLFLPSFGSFTGNQNYVAHFDSDGDGDIDSTDLFTRILRNFGTFRSFK